MDPRQGHLPPSPQKEDPLASLRQRMAEKRAEIDAEPESPHGLATASMTTTPRLTMMRRTPFLRSRRRPYQPSRR